MERVVVRFYYDRPDEDQILVTFGVGIILVEAIRAVFGGQSQNTPIPDWGQGASDLGVLMFPFPWYKIQTVAISAGLLLAFYLILYKTKLGLVVRAGIEDAGMVSLLGINVYRVFLIVFGLGAMAAGLAGIINSPITAPTPDVGARYLVLSFVVIVIGRRRLVPRRGAGRDRGRRDHDAHLAVQPVLFGGDAVRGDGADPAAAAAGLLRPGGARVMPESTVLDAPPRAAASRRRLPLPELGLAATLLVAPFVLPLLAADVPMLSRILVWGLFGLGFSILFGFTGLLSLGQAVFFGTGGFVAAWLMVSQRVNVLSGAAGRHGGSDRDRDRDRLLHRAPARHLFRHDHARLRRDVRPSRPHHLCRVHRR